jgi:hypothetical protein
MAGEHVFRDGRIGVWNITPANLKDRAKKLAALGFTDVFVPRETTKEQAQAVRDVPGLYLNLWVAPHGRSAEQFAAETIQDVVRVLGTSGAVDLNVELSKDVDLLPYMTRAVMDIRATMKSRRLRLNVAWRKGGFVPTDLVIADPNLFVCEQNYVDPAGMSMSPTSALDAYLNLTDHGIPPDKASVCYGAAGPVGGKTGAERVNTLPNGGGWMPRRGVVFSDDLLTDGGLL